MAIIYGGKPLDYYGSNLGSKCPSIDCYTTAGGTIVLVVAFQQKEAGDHYSMWMGVVS